MERRISLKTDKTKRMNQREYSGDLTEEQLTRLLQEAYEEEIPILSEELLQKTLKKAEAVEQEAEEQSKVRTSFIRWLIGNVKVKRCVVVGAMCMLLFVCGKIVQENGTFVKKESASESYDMASVKNEASGSMYFNDATSNDIGLLADSEENVREEMKGMEQECADGFPQAETETTDISAAEKVEQEKQGDLSQSKAGTTDDSSDEQIEQEVEQVKTENGQTVSKEENFGIDSTDGKEEKESIYESLAELLPQFPKKLREKEAVYELWIDGIQIESGWELYLEHALRHSPPELLFLQEEWSDGLTEADTLSADTIFSEADILFTLIVSLGETKYCMEVGTCTKVTIEQNGEKRSVLFEILDLTRYEEILTMK